MGIEQSGSITPGHGVKWVSDNIIGDSGALPAAQRVLASLANADFNTDTDQPLLLPASIQAFQLTGIVIARPTLSLTTAVGGFYPEADKGGTAIVAAAQTYATLTDPAKLMQATLTADVPTTYFTRATLEDWAIYFSLTTAQGAAARANIFLVGIDLTL